MENGVRRCVSVSLMLCACSVGKDGMANAWYASNGERLGTYGSALDKVCAR
jgi:hypothetical protein